jgi:membrane protease YdiL (CAAX protease family)
MTTTQSKLTAIIKAISFWIGWLLLLHLCGAFEGFFPANIKSCIFGIIGSLIAFGLTWAYLKSEQRAFRDIGLNFQTQTPLRFVYGALIGAAIFAVMTALLLLVGKLHLIYTGASAASVLISIVTLFWLALMEEIAFRCYPFLKLKDNFGLIGAQLIAAIGFAAYHFSIGWSLQSVLMGPFVWAWVYGLAAVWSRGIALPTGLHMMVNIGQVLTGMSGIGSGIFKLDFDSADHSNTQVVLIGLHVVVLIVAVGLTYYFNSLKSKRNGVVD